MLISLKRKIKPVTDKDHLSLLLPTRNRTQMLEQVFESMEKTVAQKSKVAVWLYIDHDDQPSLDAIQAGKFNRFTFSINWVVGQQSASLGEIHNILWQECTSGSGIFMLHADDTMFVTEGWDDLIRAAYNKYPDRILVAHPHDPALHEPTFQMILSAEWMAVTGYFSTAYFPFWFDDTWLDQVGQIIGRREQLPIQLQPIGGKGKTNRMRNMPFWTSVYNHTLDDRVHTAKALLKAMHADSETERKHLEQAERAVISQFKQEGENFSDLYAIFREERHSGLTPEQRQRFDEMYFALESKSLAKLLGKAVALMKAQRYAEAITILDVTMYSEIRTPYVNQLKSDCLRAMGKTAEADKLAAENAQAWPKNPLLRRWFRFVAYVFVEAKRMVYSKW